MKTDCCAFASIQCVRQNSTIELLNLSMHSAHIQEFPYGAKKNTQIIINTKAIFFFYLHIYKIILRPKIDSDNEL